MIEKYYIFYLLALLAEILGTVSGFGSSILFVPIASMFFDFKMILGITAIFHVFSNLSKIALFRKGIDREVVIKLGIPAVLFVLLGALLSKYVPQREMELILSIFLVFVSIYIIIYSQKNLKRSNRNLISGGIASGFMAGLIGTGGAIRGIVLAAFNLEKEVFIASSAFIDLGVDSSRAIVYYLNGYMNPEMLIMILPLILISIVGTFTGKQILKHIPQKQFKLIVISLIILTSLIQAVKYFYEF